MYNNRNSLNNGNIKRLIRRDWNVICDVCGRKRKKSETEMAYGTGDIAVILSCRDGCADYRHPLNSAPPVIFDGQPVPDARPDVSSSQLSFISVTNTSFLKWGSFRNAGKWGTLNNPNNTFNVNGIWTWGNFKRNT